MKHQRIFIYPKDIQTLTNRSASQVTRILKDMRVHFNKEKHHRITIEECAEFFGIGVDAIRKAILILGILFTGNGV